MSEFKRAHHEDLQRKAESVGSHFFTGEAKQAGCRGKTRVVFHSPAWDVLDEKNRYVASVYDDTRWFGGALFSVYATREDDSGLMGLAGNFESDYLAWRFVADELERRGYEFESPVNIS